MLTHNTLILLLLLHLLDLPLKLHIILLLYLFSTPLLLQLQLLLSRHFILNIISVHFISLFRDCWLNIPLLHLLIQCECIRHIILFLLLLDLKLTLSILPLLNFDVIKIISLISLRFVLIILLHKLPIHLRSLLIRVLILA